MKMVLFVRHITVHFVCYNAAIQTLHTAKVHTDLSKIFRCLKTVPGIIIPKLPITDELTDHNYRIALRLKSQTFAFYNLQNY